jgi:predicted ABC-type ATPase
MDKTDIEILKGLISLIKCNNGKFSKQDVVMLKGVNELLKVFNDEEFERLHPRDKDGKFSRTNGGKGFVKDTHKNSDSLNHILKSVSESNKNNISFNDVLSQSVESFNKNNDKKISIDYVKQKIDFAEKYNEGIKNKHLETQTRYSNSKGVYNRERAEYHKEIIKELFKNYEDAKPKEGENPTFIVLGGRGGSGKSKFNGLVYDKSKYIVLDADEIKNFLPEYKGYNAYEVHEESSDILKQALGKARKLGLNVVLDGTMKSLGSTENKIKDFEQAGYNIEMYYMHLPREKATERAIGRFMGENGRYVPFEVLTSMKENEANFDKLKKYASKWAFYNNDVPRKEDKPILIDKNY